MTTDGAGPAAPDERLESDERERPTPAIPVLGGFEDYPNPPPGRAVARTNIPQTSSAAGRDDQTGAGTAPPRSAASDWVSRLFGRTPVRTDDADNGDTDREQPGVRPTPDHDQQPSTRPGTPRPGERAAPSAPAQTSPLSEGAAAVARQLAGLSADELSGLSQTDGPFARAVQSEIDRRTARANRMRDDAGRTERQQRILGLKEQARQARQTDVYKAAELEEQVDAYQQQENFVRGLVEAYDRVSIDPIMHALPDAERAPLLADLPEGMDGRRQLVQAALQRLEQLWRADEARKLRGTNGSVARRPRPRPADEDDGEPELVSGIGRGRNGTPTMNDWLRTQFSR